MMCSLLKVLVSVPGPALPLRVKDLRSHNLDVGVVYKCTFFSFIETSYLNPILLASYYHVQELISRPHPQGGCGAVCLYALAILDPSGLCMLHLLAVCVW